jgi:rubrerythrin
MSGLIIMANTPVRLAADYAGGNASFGALSTAARQQQWDVATDIDWTLDPDASVRGPTADAELAAFKLSPLARYGEAGWRLLGQERQAWMVGEFQHGEQGALIAAARLVETLPHIETKACAASQAADEARHVDAFSRYIRERIADPYPPSQSMTSFLDHVLRHGDWDMTALGLHVVLEPVALAVFRLAKTIFPDELIKQIIALVARDEARHVAFGLLLLKDVYAEMSDAERKARQEFVIEAIHRMSRRFLLEDVWARLGIRRSDGIAFASTDAMMLAHRQAVFARVASNLSRVGLLTPSIRAEMEKLGLLGRAAQRVVLRQTVAETGS